MSLPTTKEVITTLNKDIFEFFWNAKCNKIKRAVVIQEYRKGGLKMLDINKFIMSLKCSWIKRLIVGHSSWTSILKAINGEDFVSLLFDYGDAFITECVIPKNNNFWKDVFKSMLNLLRIIIFKKTFYLCIFDIIATLEFV